MDDDDASVSSRINGTFALEINFGLFSFFFFLGVPVVVTVVLGTEIRFRIRTKYGMLNTCNE